MTICSKCGAENDSGDRFCRDCGSTLGETERQPGKTPFPAYKPKLLEKKDKKPDFKKRNILPLEKKTVLGMPSTVSTSSKPGPTVDKKPAGEAKVAAPLQLSFKKKLEEQKAEAQKKEPAAPEPASNGRKEEVEKAEPPAPIPDPQAAVDESQRVTPQIPGPPKDVEIAEDIPPPPDPVIPAGMEEIQRAEILRSKPLLDDYRAEMVTVPPAKGKKGFSWMMAVGAVLVTLLICVCAFLLYQNLKLKKEISQLRAVKEPAPVVVEKEPAPEEVKKWKVTLEGIPEDAMVYVDNVRHIEQPVIVKDKEEPRTFKIETHGFELWETTVVVQSDIVLTVQMNPILFPDETLELAEAKKKKKKRKKGKPAEKPAAKKKKIDTAYPGIPK